MDHQMEKHLETKVEKALGAGHLVGQSLEVRLEEPFNKRLGSLLGIAEGSTEVRKKLERLTEGENS